MTVSNVRPRSLHVFLILLLGLFVVFKTVAQNADINLLKEIHIGRDQSLDPAFRTITRSVTPLSISVPAGYITYALLKKDSVSRSSAMAVTSGVLVAGLVSTTFKYVINKNRPYETYTMIENVTADFTPTFPSGHTSFAFALATNVSLDFKKWYVTTGSFLWAGAVGYSRMHLGVHYPSDVLAGALIGSGSAILSRKLTRWVKGIHSKKRKQQLRY